MIQCKKVKRRKKMKRHLTSLILTVVLVIGGVNVIPAGTKDVSAAMQLNEFDAYYTNDLGTSGNFLGESSKEGKWSIDENGVIKIGRAHV